MLQTVFAPPALTIPIADQTFNVRRFGAIGNRVTHPIGGLSTFATTFVSGWTLAQWQAAYPFVTALTNEADWVGTVAAKIAAEASPSGGCIYLPAGWYKYDQAIPTFPIYQEDGGAFFYGPLPANGPISMKGDGQGTTTLELTRELTANRGDVYFISDYRTTASNAASCGFFEDFTVVGPAGKTTGDNFTVGKPYGFTSGIGAASKRMINRVSIINFYVGLGLCGDHTSYHEVRCNHCTFGAYYDVKLPDAFGDSTFVRCALGSSTMAGLGIGPTVSMVSSVFIKVVFDNAPMSVMKVTGANGDPYLMVGCLFMECQFEDVGVAAFGDIGMLTGATPAAWVSDSNRFINCQFGYFNTGWAPGTNITNGVSTPHAMFGLFNVTGEIVIESPLQPQLWAPGRKGMWDIIAADRLVLRGNGVQQMITASIAGASTAGGGTIGVQSDAAGYWCPDNNNMANCIIETKSYSAKFVYGFGSGLTTLGQIAVRNLSNGNYSQSTGSATEWFAGILVGTSTNTKIILAYSGVVSLPTPSISGIAPLRMGANGTVVVASGPTDTTSQIIGLSGYNGGKIAIGLLSGGAS